MNKERIAYLLTQYSAKTSTPAEDEELMAYFCGTEDATFLEVMKEWITHREPGYQMPLPAANAAFQAILAGGNDKKKPVRSLHIRTWTAAAAVLLIAAGLYIWRSQRTTVERQDLAGKPIDVPPGRDGAILTLADGSSVLLDSTGNGVVADQRGAQLRLQHGQLAYHPTGKIDGDLVYNTVTTPKGRQFSVTLPDGTQVWLNAASSLRYPTVFKGRTRDVEMTGEAYFEVTDNAGMPFRVTTQKKATVEVLGTHFNVNAYENEPTLDATLLEGSIKIGGIILRPGQQAKVGEGTKVNENVDIDGVMAWKNGFFEFDGVSLGEVMAQIERWYDVEVVYENGIPDIQFGGEVSRDLNLAALLRTLGKAGVHYRMDDNRKLVIMK